jgi:hypothetical protein
MAERSHTVTTGQTSRQRQEEDPNRQTTPGPQHLQPARPLRSFPRELPFEVRPTNLHGVFALSAPPAAFDPNTARPSELARNGFLWPRPGHLLGGEIEIKLRAVHSQRSCRS